MAVMELGVAASDEERLQRFRRNLERHQEAVRSAPEVDFTAWPKDGLDSDEFQRSLIALLDKVEELIAGSKDNDPSKARRNTRGSYEASAQVLLCNLGTRPPRKTFFRWRSSSSESKKFNDGTFDNPAGTKQSNFKRVIQAAEALGWIASLPSAGSLISVREAVRSSHIVNPASRFEVLANAPVFSDPTIVGYHPNTKFVLRTLSIDDQLYDGLEGFFPQKQIEQNEQLLKTYNEIIRGVTIALRGEVKPHGRRVAECRNYRFYGGIWQNMPRRDRPHLSLNGEPTAELDFSGMFPRLLYHTQGQDYLDGEGKPGDLYKMGEGVERKHWKMLFQIALNNDKLSSARQSLYSRLRGDYGDDRPWPADIEDIWDRRLALFDHLKKFHAPIAHRLFSKSEFAELTKWEAEITRGVIKWAVDETQHGNLIPMLPIHDSFIVPVKEKEHLRGAMRMLYRARFGFDPVISEK